MGALYMELIARNYLVYELTESGKILGIVSAGAAIPFLVFGPLGGTITDKISRRRIMQFSQGAIATTSLSIGLSITTETVTWVHLLVSALLHGVSISFLWPARQAIIPKIAGKDGISNAMALNAAGMSATSLLGPAAAGFLYILGGAEAVFYTSSFMAMTAIVFTSLISKPTFDVPKSNFHLIDDMVSGLRYISGQRVQQCILALMVATTLFIHTSIFLLPIIVVSVYHRSSDAFGMMVSMEGLGSLTGSLVFASIVLRRKGLTLIVSSMLSGIVLLMVAQVTEYYMAVAIMVGLGLAESGRRVLSEGLLLTHSEESYRGRVLSLYNMVVGLMPLSVIPAGVAMDLLGGQTTLAILGSLMIASASLVLVTQRELRTLP